MVRALDRKLLRDLLRLKGQVITIALVVACGVATFLTFVGAYRSLKYSEEEFYRAARFSQVFAACVRAPADVEQRLAAIDGVGVVETRVAANVVFDMPGYNEPIRGRLVSLPSLMNLAVLRGGSTPIASDEALVNEPFARAHKLRPGSLVRLTIEGLERTFRVSGIAQSPEYVVAMRPESPTVDDARYGILWAQRDTVEAVMGMEGAFNDVTIALSPRASERSVLANVDRVLEPYGGIPAVGRDEQISHRFVKNELDELRTWAILLPSIFVGVAAFLLNIVLARLIGTQREQIAALKAFGYGNARIASHYLEMVAIVILLGSALGVGLGAFLGDGLTNMYRIYFRFPELSYRLEGSIVVVGVAITFVLAALGAAFAVRSAIRLSPAEAMRPPAPARYRPSVLERIGLRALLSNTGRIVLRNVSRRPLRALISIVGIALATAIIVVGLFFGDAVKNMMSHQFGRVMREDVNVMFRLPTEDSAISELKQIPGVLNVEPVRMMPVRAAFGHRHKNVILNGLPRGAEMRVLRHREGMRIPLPEKGVVMTTWLAELLGVGIGDTLNFEVLDYTHAVRDVRVAALVDEVFGQQLYMQLDALNQLLGEQDSISGALLSVDSRAAGATELALKAKPGVVAVMRKSSVVESFQKTTGGWMTVVSSILTMFAGVIALGVVYNTARINLAERERELASLRVLGFTVGEITTIFAGELAVLVVAGIPFGFMIGRGIAWMLLRNAAAEGIRFPLLIEPATLAISALVVAGAAIASGLIVRRKLDRLDLVAVLKTRD